MKFALKTTLLAAAVGLATLSHANFVEGKDYQVLANPENIAGDVIVVREFFWYGCPHCYNLEPHMQKWAKTRANDVAFFQTPAAMNPMWEVAARGFYAAQQLGAQEKTHQILFDTVHKDGNRRVIGSQSELSNWYAAQSFYGEVLDFAIGIGEITGSGIEIYTTITRKADDQLIALVKNGMVFFDYQQQKVAKVPERFVQFLGS